MVVCFLGLVDEPLLLLLGLVHLVEGPFDRVRRDHILKPHINDTNSSFILVEDLLKLLLSHLVDLFPVLENIVEAPVPHDAPIHRFADVSKRLGRVTDVKEVFSRILSPELNNPFDIDHIQIACEHQGFPFPHSTLFILGPNARTNGSKTKSLRIHLFHVYLVDLVDSKRNLKVKTFSNYTKVLTKSKDHPPVAR